MENPQANPIHLPESDEDGNCPTKAAVVELTKIKPELFDFLTKDVDYRQFFSENNGCYGLATKLLYWPNPLILGGIEMDDNGGLVKAEALHSILILAKGYSDSLNASMDALNVTIVAKKMMHVISGVAEKNVEVKFNTEKSERRIYAASMAALKSMKSFGSFPVTSILIGYGFMLLYVAYSLISWKDYGVSSSSGLAFLGTLVIFLATIAGLGLSAYIGIPFNAIVMQIVPFLALGLAVDDMFLLIHSYKGSFDTIHKHTENEIAILLKETGLSVCMTSLSNIVSLLCCSFINVPALQAFCQQVALALALNWLGIVGIFAPLIALDLRRRKSYRVDILVWFKAPPEEEKKERRQAFPDETEKKSFRSKLKLTYFVNNAYAPMLKNMRVKGFVLFATFLTLITSLYGVYRLELGLEMTEVVPESEPSYEFFKNVEKYFGFDFMLVGLKDGIDYPNQQYQMNDFIDEIMNSSFAVSLKPGRFGDHWVAMFRIYLLYLQGFYINDMKEGHIEMYTKSSSGQETFPLPGPKASAEGRLVYKMLCNSGEGVDCRRNNGVNLLVDRDNLINFDGYYKYLTVWYALDPISSSASFAKIYPIPPEWKNKIGDYTQTIPAAYPPLFSQLLFILNGFSNTPKIVKAIKEIRAIIDRYTKIGFPSYPISVYFTYWELYIELPKYLIMSLGVTMACIFLLLSVLLWTVKISFIIVVMVLVTVVELGGIMGIVGLHINPVSAVICITAVGIGVEFTVHMCLSFLTCTGTKNSRMKRSLGHMFTPVVHGGISTILGLVMLGFSELLFIVRYFFVSLTMMVIMGMVNGLLVLPVLLSLTGPKSEVRGIKIGHFKSASTSRTSSRTESSSNPSRDFP